MTAPYMDSLVHAHRDDMSADQFDWLQRHLIIANKDKPGEYVKMYHHDLVTGMVTMPRSQAHLFPGLEDRTVLGRKLDLPKSTFVARDGQEDLIVNTLDYLEQMGGGLAEADCGTGKTIMGAEIALRYGRSTCILVHKHFLVSQWRMAFHGDPENNFPGLCPEAKIGYITKDQCDSGEDFDIVIGVVQSITSPKRTYPQEVYDSFGLVLADEVHRHGSDRWQNGIIKFPGKRRLGLTAEAYRADGMMPVIWNHFGRTAAKMVSDEKQSCRVHFVNMQTPLSRDAYVQVWDGEVNRARLISALSKIPGRNDVIARLMVKALEAGRKIFVLSERRDQLKELAARLEAKGIPTDDIGYYVGGRSEKKLAEAARRRVILSTYQMAQEALNIPDLDTLFMATPMVRIRQSVGRILRIQDGKKEPVVVDFVDQTVAPCMGYKGARIRQYRALGYEIDSGI